MTFRPGSTATSRPGGPTSEIRSASCSARTSRTATGRGREPLVDDWLKGPDQPEAWDAKYEPYAVDGDRAVATGWSRYAATDDEPERTYHNAYLLRFDADGRCAEFHEFYMLEGT